MKQTGQNHIFAYTTLNFIGADQSCLFCLEVKNCLGLRYTFGYGPQRFVDSLVWGNC